MILALDVGNTNITVGVFDGEDLRFVSRMATDASRMEDQYAIELRDILHLYGVRRANITGAVLSSVVPKLTGYLSHAVEKLFSVTPLVVDYQAVKEFFSIGITRPETTGPDLIAGCMGAKARFSYPCIVVDMGTATTLAVLDREGVMVGGAIVPGVGVSLDALTSRAALLSSVSLDTPAHVVGRDTAECLQSGVLFGAAALLDGLCDRMEEELGYPCRVIATGGLAGLVVEHCRRKVEYSDTLLLDGLKAIYDQAGK
jgi:type III pantothenate kinase